VQAGLTRAAAVEVFSVSSPPPPWSIIERVLHVLNASSDEIESAKSLFDIICQAGRITEDILAGLFFSRFEAPESLPQETVNDNGLKQRDATRLAQVMTQRQFMGTLRVLRSRSGVSYRDIAKEMERVDVKQAMSKSTINNLFLRDVMPRNQYQTRVLVLALLRAAQEPEKFSDDYMRVWAGLVESDVRYHDEPVTTSRGRELIDVANMTSTTEPLSVAEDVHVSEKAAEQSAVSNSLDGGDTKVIEQGLMHPRRPTRQWFGKKCCPPAGAATRTYSPLATRCSIRNRSGAGVYSRDPSTEIGKCSRSPRLAGIRSCTSQSAVVARSVNLGELEQHWPSW
jgi:hypothetical protein